MSRCIQTRILWRLLVVAVALAGLSLGTPQAGRAADPLKDTTSLQFVPDNVAFYVAGMRLREVYTKVASSKAIAKLKQVPAIQFGLGMAMAQWENSQNPQITALKQALQDPQNQQLVAMLKDAVSQEVFIYGGDTFGDLITLINELNAASNAAQLEALASANPQNLQAIQIRKMVEALDRAGGQAQVPDFRQGCEADRHASGGGPIETAGESGHGGIRSATSAAEELRAREDRQQRVPDIAARRIARAVAHDHAERAGH